MADIRSSALARKKIAEWVGSTNHELVKFVEDISEDVRVSIPDAITAATAGDAQAIISSAVFLPRNAPAAPEPADAQSVAAMTAFLPRHESPISNPADAQSVLAGQIFGA